MQYPQSQFHGGPPPPPGVPGMPPYVNGPSAFPPGQPGVPGMRPGMQPPGMPGPPVDQFQKMSMGPPPGTGGYPGAPPQGVPSGPGSFPTMAPPFGAQGPIRPPPPPVMGAPPSVGTGAQPPPPMGGFSARPGPPSSAPGPFPQVPPVVGGAGGPGGMGPPIQARPPASVNALVPPPPGAIPPGTMPPGPVAPGFAPPVGPPGAGGSVIPRPGPPQPPPMGAQGFAQPGFAPPPTGMMPGPPPPVGLSANVVPPPPGGWEGGQPMTHPGAVHIPPGSQGQYHPGGLHPPTRQAVHNRIDPSQIPRPTVAQQTEAIVFETRFNHSHNHPPPSTSHFIVRDRGSTGPRYMRATLNNVPNTTDLLGLSQMPLAVVVQPLALPDPQDDPIQVVDMGESGPVRCARCKAYMNPFMLWSSNGKSFTCNFCNHNNPCPDSYFCYIGPDGRRRDVDERPELSKGTVEYVAPSDYMVRSPMAPAHFFLIDVSANALASGATASCCMCIEQILDHLQGNDRALVGIATYDSAVHFYSLSAQSTQPHMLVMADINDVYAPASKPLLGRVADFKAALVELLQSIPIMFRDNKVSDSCGAAALEAAIEVLKPTGGQVHAFLAMLPNVGSRALKNRDLLGPATDKDKDKLAVLQSADNTYKTLATVAADFQVCVDLFFLTQGYVDIATLSDLSNTTGGSLYNYPQFNPLLDQDQLLNDLKWNVTRPRAMEALMRVRCSGGLEVDGYLGAFYRRPNNFTDIDLPALDCDKAIVAKLIIMEKLQAGQEVYLQSALLYTSTEGQRKVRVQTLALPITDSIGQVFKGADLDAQVSLISRQVAINLPSSGLTASKDQLTTRTVNTLYAYRKYCATSSSPVQLILPEALKLLPLYSLALLKSACLRGDAKADERGYWCASVISLPTQKLMAFLHPRLIALHQLLDKPEPERLPDGVVLSSENLHTSGVFLMENGFDALLFVDKEAPEALVHDLVGFKNVEEMSRVAGQIIPVPRDTAASKLLHAVLRSARLQRCAFMRLRCVKKGDPTEALFLNMLIEDRSQAGMSYVEYLCQVHRLIQNKMQ